MKTLSLIQAAWLQPFVDYFAERKVDLRRYFETCSIDPTTVGTADGWITKKQLYRFLEAVATGESMSELGFLVGDRMTMERLGAIGRATLGEQTLAEAVREFCSRIDRSTEDNRAWLEEGESSGEMWLLNRTSNPFEANRQVADHAGLMSLVNVVRVAAGSDWYPDRIVLQTPATRAFKKIDGLAAATVRFDQAATGLAFPSAWLLRSLRAQSAWEGEDELLQTGEATVDKLKRILRGMLGVGGLGPSVRLTAELCQVSPRTLQRHLAEAGSTFRELLEEVRIEQAQIYLLESDRPVKAIAYDLGYSGANNFIRAFKRMKGSTPTEYRRAQQ